MFRPISNPPSRYASTFAEWEIPPPPARVEVVEDHSASILSANDSPDLGFRWSVNPYRGCQHGCAYCYARPSHETLGYGAGTDFETRLVVKPRAPDLLREAFDRPSWRGELILFSGNVDCYQPLEVHHRLTRGLLEVCLAYRNPAAVITRSAVIERDVDLLADLARTVGLGVTVSIPVHDPVDARKLEPMAPSPARRMKVIRRLSEAGIPVGINVAPVIPGLTDRSIPALLQEARDAGARHASMILLRLPGAVAQVFEERLREHFPLRADAVLNRLRAMRGGGTYDPRFGHRMTGQGASWQATRALFELWRDRLGYVPRAPPLDPSPFRRPGQAVQLGLFGSAPPPQRA